MKKLLFVLCMLFFVIALTSCESCFWNGCDFEWVFYEYPTCYSTGTWQQICTKCGNEGSDILDCWEFAPHSTEGRWEVVLEPSCTREGKKQRHCAECDAVVEVATIPKTDDHTLGVEWSLLTAATCEKEGERGLRCIYCQKLLVRETIPYAHEPDYIWTYIKDSTCTEPGVKVLKCIKCGDVCETDVVPPYHHPRKTIPRVEPTCYSVGSTMGQICSGCGTVMVPVEEIPMLTHNFITVEAVEATCSDYGYTEGIQCTLCDAWKVEPEQIEKLPHTVVVDAAVAPDCTTCGYTEGSHCSVCDLVIEKQNYISSLGHDFGLTNTCSRCFVKRYNEITSREAFDEYEENNSFNAVVYLDQCVNVSKPTEWWTVYVNDEVKYIRLVGTPGVEYNVRFVIPSSRDANNDIQIDLFDATIKTVAGSGAPIIESNSDATVHIGLYGEKCGIIGRYGADGADDVLTTAYPEDGETGYTAVRAKGKVQIYLHADYAVISGGDGGNGGDGESAYAGLLWAPVDGGDGADGGDGGYAIEATEIYLRVMSGYSSNNLVVTGGQGGKGGAGGKGGPGHRDGSRGEDGNASSATTVLIRLN